MYVINPKNFDQDKLFQCNQRLGYILIYIYMIPLFGKDDNKNYYFSKTELLNKALEKIKGEGGEK